MDTDTFREEPPRIGHYGKNPPGQYSNEPENICLILFNFQNTNVVEVGWGALSKKGASEQVLGKISKKKNSYCYKMYH